MIRMINEDFFDSVEPEDYEPEIEDIEGDYDELESKKDWKYILCIKYNMHNDNPPSMRDGTYVYNVRKLVGKMRKCVELLGLFKKYYIDKVDLKDPNNHSYNMNVDMTFDRPEPEDFDLYEHYGGKRWNSFMPTFYFYVYFDECVNLSFKSFCDKIYTMRNLIRTRVCEFPKDGISYEFINNYSGETISYEVTGWFSEGTLETIYNELYNKEGDERLVTSTRKDSYMESVLRKNQLEKIVDVTVRLAKQKYNIELTPHFIHNPEGNGRRPIKTHPFVTFDLNKEGAIDVKEIEKCMLDCFFNRLSMDYFYFMTPVAVVKPLCKVTNNESTPIKNQDYHNFFVRTLRKCSVCDYHTRQNRTMWRLRECSYGNYGSGHSFFIAIVDKHGLIMRDHSKFESSMYSDGDMNGFVKDIMTDDKIWN